MSMAFLTLVHTVQATRAAYEQIYQHLHSYKSMKKKVGFLQN